MITHVVFDFDGTLADSPHLVVDLYNDLAHRHGYRPLTAENLDALRGLSVRERCERLGVPLYRLPVLITQVAREYRTITGRVRLHAGIPDLLRHLRGEGYRVAIVSTNNEENIREVLRHHGLEGDVAAVVCSNRLFGKAGLLRRLMRREGLRPGGLVYVGDEHRDVEASREAGVEVIAVGWGIDTEARLRAAAPDQFARHPEDIRTYLRARHRVPLGA